MRETESHVSVADFLSSPILRWFFSVYPSKSHFFACGGHKECSIYLCFSLTPLKIWVYHFGFSGKKCEFTFSKFEFALSKFQFTFLKCRFTLSKFRFTLTKIEFTLSFRFLFSKDWNSWMKFQKGKLKFRKNNVKFRDAKLKLRNDEI